MSVALTTANHGLSALGSPKVTSPEEPLEKAWEILCGFSNAAIQRELESLEGCEYDGAKLGRRMNLILRTGKLAEY